MDKRVWYVFGILVLILAIIVGINFSPQLTGKAIDDSGSDSLDEWTMFGRDLARTSWDGIDFPVISNLFNASYEVGGIVYSSPTVANGYVYIGSHDTNAYQLNASNVSQLIAVYSAPTSYVNSPPTIVNGYAYFGSHDNNLYQLNASNISQLISSYSTTHNVESAPIVLGDSVYISDNNGWIYQLNATNVGQLISSSRVLGGRSFTAAGDYLYLTNINEGVYQLNASNISQIIEHFDDGELLVYSSPAVEGGYLYIGTNKNTLYQLNASNISQKIAEYLVGGDIQTSPAVANGYVYFGSHDYNVYQLNASNISNFVASYNTGGIIQSTPTFANGYIFVGSRDDYMYQLNASNISQLISRYQTGGDIYSSPAVANGYVYFGSENKLYQLSAFNVSSTSPLIFSNFSDNSGKLIGSGVAKFNISVENTNGTVYLNIGENSYLANNLGGNIYSFDLVLSTGSYDYYWSSYGNNLKLISSDIQTYFVTQREEPSGGGGGGSTGLPAEDYDLGELDEFDNETLDLKYGGEVSFDFEGEDYGVTLENIDRANNEATLEISPVEKQVILRSNQNKDVDLNDDLVDDINVGVGEISIDEVEINLQLKRKVSLRKKRIGSDVKAVAREDTSETVRSFDTFGSRIFGWIGDLFDNNKFRCRRLSNYNWVGSLDFCVNGNVPATYNNRIILNYLKENIEFGKNFVQIEEITIYDCEGCFYVRGAVDNSLEEFYFQNWEQVSQICTSTVSCSDISIQCGSIDDGCGRVLDCGQCNRGYFCADNRCIPDPVPLTCDDSDNGENYFEWGEATDRWGPVRDRCDGDILLEAICQGISASFVRHDCPQGCANGVCLGEEWCQDDEPENDIFIFGTSYDIRGISFEDSCESGSNMLEQFYCDASSESIQSSFIECEFGCSEGVCNRGVCSDSDLNDTSIKGIVSDNSGSYEDYCSDSNTLVEGICENIDQGSRYGTISIDCPGSCQEGKCIESEPLCSDTDGIDFYTQGTTDSLFTDGSIRSRLDSCTNTTSSIGWTQDILGIYNYERYCDPAYEDNFPHYRDKLYECPEGCSAGKCLVPKNETSYCDDTGYCKLYLGEYLIFDEFLAMSADYVYTNEGLYINGYYEYSHPQKTDLLFEVGESFSVRSGELNEGNSFDYNFSDQGFFWMNITVLNLFSNRDSSTVYETTATPYVEFIYDIPDYESSSKKRKPSLRRSTTKPVLKSSVSYEPPTVFTKISRAFVDFFKRGDVGTQNIESRRIQIRKKTLGGSKPVLK